MAFMACFVWHRSNVDVVILRIVYSAIWAAIKPIDLHPITISHHPPNALQSANKTIGMVNCAIWRFAAVNQHFEFHFAYIILAVFLREILPIVYFDFI